MLRFAAYLKEGKMNFRRMSPGEWAKLNSQTNEPRLDILRRVIKDKIEIPLWNGTLVTIDNTKENLDAVNTLQSTTKAVKLKASNGEISSSVIGKSPLFGGGGGGSGGGTAQTQYAESLQCVFIQALLDSPRIQPFEYYDIDKLKRAAAKTQIGGTGIEEMMSLDPTWHWSSYWTAKALIKRGYVSKSHTFHRGSEIMKAIYKKKTNAVRNSNLGRFSDDKWNPGDIWAVKKGVNVNTVLDDSSIDTLNATLLNAYNKRDIVGISLKKVVSETGLKISELNLEAGYDEHTFTNATLMTTFARQGASFWRSKKGDIYFDVGKMDVRSSSAFSAINVEINLKTARGGRAGMSEWSRSLKKHLNVTAPSNPALGAIAKELHKSGSKSRYAKQYYNMAKLVHPEITEKDFMDGIQSRPAGDLHSKLGAIFLTYHLTKAKRSGLADKVITDLVNYAGSKSAESSVYLKVYE